MQCNDVPDLTNKTASSFGLCRYIQSLCGYRCISLTFVISFIILKSNNLIRRIYIDKYLFKKELKYTFCHKFAESTFLTFF